MKVKGFYTLALGLSAAFTAVSVGLVPSVGVSYVELSGPTGVSASQALASLPVKGRAPKTGYDRALFGIAWFDQDQNGCDTRNDILTRDLVKKTYKPGTCVVLTGVLNDPYSGKAIAFKRGVGTSSIVQIDHVVALMDSWQKGSQKWNPATRRMFANDPLNLLATSGKLNQQKGASDAATWLPPRVAFRCAYVARQIAVKKKYSLWVTSGEKNAMSNVLAKCPKQVLPVR